MVKNYEGKISCMSEVSIVEKVAREEHMKYKGHSGTTQTQPFILLARLLHFRMWTEGDEEEKEKERGRKK